MYIFHMDPGHGWLAVKLAELEALNIADKITPYSYQRGQTAYLEEDQDAATFITAKVNALGLTQDDARKAWFTKNIRESFRESTPIRGYASYSTPTPEARAI